MSLKNKKKKEKKPKQIQEEGQEGEQGQDDKTAGAGSISADALVLLTPAAPGFCSAMPAAPVRSDAAVSASTSVSITCVLQSSHTTATGCSGV